MASQTIYRHYSTSTLLSQLEKYLPKSLALLRVIQSAEKRPDALHLANFSEDAKAPADDYIFICAVDFKSTSLAQQVNLFSSLDLLESPVPKSHETYKTTELYIRALFRYFVKEMPEDDRALLGKDDYTGQLWASIHVNYLPIIEDLGVFKWEAHVWIKYLFEPSNMNNISVRKLPEGEYTWSKVQSDDLDIVLSTSIIQRAKWRMEMLQSVGLYHHSGRGDKLVAWCFESIDGSLITLYVLPEYRGRGLAKTVSLELFKRRADEEGVRWWHSDTSEDNVQSQGMLRSIGGKKAWRLAWFGVDLKKVHEMVDIGAI